MGKKDDLKPFAGWQKRYLQFKNLFLNAYEFKNLPRSVNERYLNKILFEQGRACFFNDPALGIIALKPMNYSSLDIYGEPMVLTVSGENKMFNERLTNHKDCVIMYHNDVRDIPDSMLMDYALRIYKIERTIDVNVHAQKTPNILVTSQEQKLTAMNIIKERDSFVENILVSSDLNPDKIFSVPMVAPFVASDLQALKRDLLNEVLSYIGIESNMSEKNERLIAGEVMVSNGLAIAMRNAMLASRQRAVDELNEMFGLNVEVVATNPSLLDSLGKAEGVEIDG